MDAEDADGLMDWASADYDRLLAEGRVRCDLCRMVITLFNEARSGHRVREDGTALDIEASCRNCAPTEVHGGVGHWHAGWSTERYDTT